MLPKAYLNICLWNSGKARHPPAEPLDQKAISIAGLNEGMALRKEAESILRRGLIAGVMTSEIRSKKSKDL